MADKVKTKSAVEKASLSAEVVRLRGEIERLVTERNQLWNKIDDLNVAKNTLEGRLKDIEEVKTAEEKLASDVSKAEEMASKISDPALRTVGYAFILNQLQSAGNPRGSRAWPSYAFPFFMGM